MSAKRYLGQIVHMERRIKMQNDEITRMKEMACSLSANVTDERVQSSNSPDPMANAVANIVDKENELRDLVSRYIAKKEQITREIDELDNNLYADVLYGKYVANISFYRLCTQINRSRQQTMNIHKKALMDFEKKFPKVFD